MTLEELKAHAYDLIAQFEAIQVELRKTNDAITNFGKPEVSEVSEEVEK